MIQGKLKNKDINFLSVYEKRSEPSKYIAALKYTTVPVFLSVLFVGFFAFQSFQTYQIKEKTQKLKQETDKIAQEVQEDPNLEKIQNLTDMKNEINRLDTLYKSIESYPVLRQNTFDQILLAADLQVNIVSFSYLRESQIITLNVETANAEDSENFVRKLKASDTFAKVDYSGYTQIEKNTAVQKEVNKPINKPAGDGSEKQDEALDSILQNIFDSMQTDTEESVKTKVYTATILCHLK